MKRCIVLMGASGAGKSTIGPALAARHGLPHLDIDTEIERTTGMVIRDIFAERGEPYFREIERDTTIAALGTPSVISLGGGTPMNPDTRAALADHHVVWLKVAVGEAVRRIGLDEGRPLLAGGQIRGTLIKMLVARTPIYESCASITVDTTGRRVDEIITEIDEKLGAGEGPQNTLIRVSAEKPYNVVVGRGVLADLPTLFPGAARVAIIHPPTLAHRVAAMVPRFQQKVTPIEVPDAEDAKSVEVLERCWRELASAGFTRSDAVVGVGGGATTDLAGFVAATWLRGVRYVAVPTTVLAMVDAAVGGKTGINLPEGKNLVGAFYEPEVVLADLDVLDTLGAHDLSSGLAEVAKAGFIADPRILEIIEADPAAVLDPHSAALVEVVERAIAVKAEVVSADLRESTSVGKEVGREVLNYGHTLGHAIERHEGYRWRHGDAVAVGMVYAAELAAGLGRLDAATVARHRSVLAALGLPTSYTGPWPDLRAAMNLDKKTRGSALRFVVLDYVADPGIAEAPGEDVLEAAFARLAG